MSQQPTKRTYFLSFSFEGGGIRIQNADDILVILQKKMRDDHFVLIKYTRIYPESLKYFEKENLVEPI